MSAPEKYIGYSGKVHVRRFRFFVGTADEMPAPENELIMLCGRRQIVHVVSHLVATTCGICQKAENTGAQFKR